MKFKEQIQKLVDKFVASEALHKRTRLEVKDELVKLGISFNTFMILTQLKKKEMQ